MRGQSGVACTGDLTCGSRCVESHARREARERARPTRRACGSRARIVIVYSSLFRHAFAARALCLCRYHDYIVTGGGVCTKVSDRALASFCTAGAATRPLRGEGGGVGGGRRGMGVSRYETLAARYEGATMTTRRCDVTFRAKRLLLIVAEPFLVTRSLVSSIVFASPGRNVCVSAGNSWCDGGSSRRWSTAESVKENFARINVDDDARVGWFHDKN